MTNQTNPTSAKPVAYCEPCNKVGMLNCGNFDECGEPRCVTCKRKLDPPTPTLSAAELGQVLDSLRVGNEYIKLYYMEADDRQNELEAIVESEKVEAAIALLEKVKP